MDSPAPRSKLLLHACCGVCSAYVPDILRREYDVTIYYDNPNIAPREEFDRRADAARTMAEKYGLPFILVPQEPVEWYRAVRGHAKDRENRERCRKCIAHRLASAFAYAKRHHFDIVATTISVSRRKDIHQVHAVGRELSEIYGTPFLDRDWRKGGGEDESQRRAVAAGIYRQEYCGCVFSKSWSRKVVES
jgi:epoxyqueuosine reductase